MQRLFSTVLLGLFLFGVAGCSLGSSKGEEPTVEAVAVAVAEAHAGTITATSQASGPLEPILSVMITAKVPGRVVAVPKQMGDPVEAGDLLVELEARDAANQLAAAQAQYAQAEAQRAEAARQASRLDLLLAQGAVSQQQADQIQTQLSLASAQVQAARAQLDLASANLEATQITAPAAGILSARLVQPGAMVGSGTPVFQLVDLQSMVVNTGVAEAQVNAIKPGVPVPVTIPSLQQSFTGHVESVSPNMDQQSRSYKVRVIVENPEGILKGGMFAEVKFPIQEQQGIIVPVAALLERSGEPFLYVVTDEMAVLTRVQVLVRSEDRVSVEGISAGAQVVVVGQNRLYDGAPVKVGGGAGQ